MPFRAIGKMAGGIASQEMVGVTMAVNSINSIWGGVAGTLGIPLWPFGRFTKYRQNPAMT